MARIDSLGHFLTDVADAIREKTGSSDAIAAEDFDTEIENIPSGGAYAPKFISFYGFTGTDLINETSGLDVSNLTTMKQMFYNCTNLTDVDLSNWGCTNIASFQQMFYNCSKLTALDLSSFGSCSASSCENMFASCSRLETLDLSNLSFTGYFNINNMFMSCSSLNFLDIRNIVFEKCNAANYTFNGFKNSCLIIVKDDTQKSWLTSHFSQLTNVKTVEEYEAE